LRFKRDRDHQSQQQTPLYQSEGPVKGSNYYVFLSVAEVTHEKFSNEDEMQLRVHEAFDRAG
jgi:hypothetical protein